MSEVRDGVGLWDDGASSRFDLVRRASQTMRNRETNARATFDRGNDSRPKSCIQLGGYRGSGSLAQGFIDRDDGAEKALSPGTGTRNRQRDLA